MLKNLKLSYKIGLGYLLIIIFMAIGFMIAILSIENMRGLSKIVQNTNEINTFIIEKEVEHLEWAQSLNNHIFMGKDFVGELDYKVCELGEFIYGVIDHSVHNQAHDYEIGDVYNIRNSRILELIQELEEPHRKLHNSVKEILEKSSLNEQNKALEMYQLETLPALNKTRNILKELRESYNQIAVERGGKAAKDIAANAQTRKIILIIINGIVLLLAIIISYFVTKGIVEPINKLTNWGKRVAKGDMEYKEIESSENEIGELNQSFKDVVTSFKKIGDVCEAIANGDYTKNFEIRGENDILAKSIDIMKNNLVEMTQHNADQDWLKNGQMKLSEILRKEDDLNKITQKIITFVAEYIGAKTGVLYVPEVSENEEILKLYASYAYIRRKTLANEFKSGEGIVGQAYLEKETIIISNIPEDYMVIGSGLGEAVPRNLVVIPCKYNENVECLIELASFESFTNIQVDFLAAISESIAVSINSAIINSKLEDALKISQNQAEELQVQQEELRQTNEELEEQTKALKKSEEVLQTQQEELRVSNEELEERTQELERQRDVINEKNLNLQKTKKELERQAKELEISSKYKSEFLANMSHELRTPLNSILMLAWMLSENKSDNLTEKQIEFAKTIHSSGTDLLNLINEILDLSKIESGNMELNIDAINLQKVGNDIHRLFEEIANKKGLEFKINIEERLPETIFTDEVRLKQVLKNLLSNAFKFTEKGKVEVDIKIPEKNTNFQKKQLNSNNSIAFEVRDTGIGISEDKQMKIFEAFQQEDGTTSRKYGGTGLGLSISKEIVKLLGGEMQLHSNRNEGSIFTIYLPMEIKIENQRKISEDIDEEPKLKRVSNEEQPKVELKENYDIKSKNSILIIEDDNNFASILKELANDYEFEGIIANNGEDGLKYAKKYLPKAILLDLGLPTIDGYEVIEELKKDKRTDKIPIHIISGEDKDKVQKEVGEKIVDCITKPVSAEKLESIFSGIETLKGEKLKNILLIEDDYNQRKTVASLIEGKDIKITDTENGLTAIKLMKERDFDCVILDLGLNDMTGFEFIERVNQDDSIKVCPIIVYTGRDLTKEEDMRLQKYAESIIIKGAKSPERLLAETTLFLNRVGTDLSDKKRKILKELKGGEESVLNKKNVLIVDDDIRNIFALSNILEDKGMKVTAGRNGREGLEKLNENPEIDIILMDIMMPEMDGYEAIKEIRKNNEYRSLPIIALTAKAMRGDREKCINAGANDYFPKPVDAEKLVSLLRVWLHK